MRRQLKPRPSIPPDGDPYFLDVEQLRKFLAYSRHFFRRWVLPVAYVYGIPAAVPMGPKYPQDWRWRADEVYAAFPSKSPFPVNSNWMSRFRARQAAELAACTQSKRSQKEAAA